MGKHERRRRVRVVYRSLQYYFLAQFFIYSAVIVFFLAVFLFVPDMLKMQDETLSLSERTSAADRVITLHIKVWPAAMVLIAMLGLHSFLTFHRLSGPLYRFRSIFNQIREGQMGYPIKIRRRDFLHTEEEALNDMLDVLTHKLQNIQQSGHEALNCLRDLEHRLDDRQDLKPIVDHLDMLISEAGYFKVDRR
ncbi:MAG: hypothetical protein JSW26_15890 [Desulfobacterales bacterium]|nr:MAG: hypothetical protein JSW26_15890 [Desulfobacterales bacterium]